MCNLFENTRSFFFPENRLVVLFILFLQHFCQSGVYCKSLHLYKKQVYLFIPDVAFVAFCLVAAVVFV